MIETPPRSLRVKLDRHFEEAVLVEALRCAFNFRTHRYVHVDLVGFTGGIDTAVSLINEIKKTVFAFVVVETPVPDGTSAIERLYAAGSDLIIFVVAGKNELRVLKEAEYIFPRGSVMVRGKLSETDFVGLDAVLLDERITSDTGGLSVWLRRAGIADDDGFFEPVMRKIWIDLSNLRRKLKVKGAEESYDSAGL